MVRYLFTPGNAPASIGMAQQNPLCSLSRSVGTNPLPGITGLNTGLQPAAWRAQIPQDWRWACAFPATCAARALGGSRASRAEACPGGPKYPSVQKIPKRECDFCYSPGAKQVHGCWKITPHVPSECPALKLKQREQVKTQRPVTLKVGPF